MLKPLTEIILVSSVASLVRDSPEDWQVEYHRPILDALKTREPEAAEKAMVDHFDAATNPTSDRGFLARAFSDAYFEAVARSGNGVV